jgi:MoxR-like ATPase
MDATEAQHIDVPRERRPDETGPDGPGADERGTGPLPVAEFLLDARAVMSAVETVIDGKREAVEIATTVLLAEGHLLVEDVPGVGKTMLARALARSVDCSVSRIQFTPDLLPADITGVSVYNQADRVFEFKPGPVFANIVIGDEINRASPKTQSALLESMEERQVSVDGASYGLPDPFTVIATQNPVEMEGTYALPEAQRDRFMARISMGYPDAANEVAMLRQRETDNPIDRLRPVVTIGRLRRMIDTARQVFVSPAVEQYVVAISAATRMDREVRLGASPRATLQLIRAAKARAALDGRDFVLPDDIDALAVPVLAHRMMSVRSSAGSNPFGGEALADITARIVAATPVPLGAAGPA